MLNRKKRQMPFGFGNQPMMPQGMQPMMPQGMQPMMSMGQTPWMGEEMMLITRLKDCKRKSMNKNGKSANC